MSSVESDGSHTTGSAGTAPAGHSRRTTADDGSHDVSGAGRTVHFAPTRGRTSSWIAVIIMIIAFTVGGLGVVFWNWWVVGISAGIFVLAFLGSLASGIMNDVH